MNLLVPALWQDAKRIAATTIYFFLHLVMHARTFDIVRSRLLDNTDDGNISFDERLDTASMVPLLPPAALDDLESCHQKFSLAKVQRP